MAHMRRGRENCAILRNVAGRADREIAGKNEAGERSAQRFQIRYNKNEGIEPKISLLNKRIGVLKHNTSTLEYYSVFIKTTILEKRASGG